MSAAVARLTQFGPDAPPNVVDHVVALAERARPEVWTDGLAGTVDAVTERTRTRENQRSGGTVWIDIRRNRGGPQGADVAENCAPLSVVEASFRRGP